jgi:hypothetical protein
MIKINGETYNGNSIIVENNNIIIDGKKVTPKEKNITITVEGNINKINADVVDEINIHGDCKSVKTMSGDVTINGYVDGNVQTMSGDVEAETINGNVSTMSVDIN